ncbi:MAG: serine/threonine protein kinase [Pseudohongiellaceae bacterium]|jgi:serine/threonine protein kinase
MTSQPDMLGKYHIQTVLGKGAMGIVYLGLDPDIDRKVAIKVLHPHLCEGTTGQDFVRRFRREAQAAARSFHANIVTVFELGKQDDTDFIVMEYIEGEELQDAINCNYRFSEDEVIFIVSSILKALAAAHAQGIIHRDIKPANILLTDDGNVKVADFGVAKLNSFDQTMQGSAVGTPSYMSPESLKGQAVTHLTDIYSVGAIMLQLLTGERIKADKLYPLKLAEFMTESLSGDRGLKISPKLKALVSQAMSENPNSRPETALSFYRRLEKLSIANAASFQCDDETQQQLVSVLTAYVGPIAPVLLKNALLKAKTIEALTIILSKSVDDSEESEELLKKVQKIVKKLSLSHDHSINNSQLLICDAATQEKLLAVLRPFLGPISPVLIKKGLLQARDHQSLLTTLASAINDEKESQEFLLEARRLFS